MLRFRNFVKLIVNLVRIFQPIVEVEFQIDNTDFSFTTITGCLTHFFSSYFTNTVVPLGRTPLNTIPILNCVKAYSKNRHFIVFIIIKIGQTHHVFLKDYVHIHQMGSHFVGGYRLDFSPTEQESKTSILQAFSTR